MNKISKPLVIVFAVLMLIMGSLKRGIWAEETQGQDAQSYKAAYRLVMEEDWSKAASALDSFISTHPQSAYTDDAQYWRCYVKEKTDRSQEEVFTCYQNFIKAYPDSSWVDNAKSNLIRIADRRAKQGKTE